MPDLGEPVGEPESTSPSPGDNYIPGGRGFTNGLHAPTTSATRLPGALVPHAPRFRMIDPRDQGLSGIVRMIGKFTGAVDSHCLDAQAWQAMTPEERIAHYITERDIERTAEAYGCRPASATPARPSAATGSAG